MNNIGFFSLEQLTITIMFADLITKTSLNSFKKTSLANKRTRKSRAKKTRKSCKKLLKMLLISFDSNRVDFLATLCNAAVKITAIFHLTLHSADLQRTLIC
jgi:hypothetical protein